VINTAAGSGETYAATYDSLAVEALEPPAPPAPSNESSATLTVTPGGGIGTSDFNTGSYTVENTGDVPITSITLDESSALFPDLVYDPAGTAGDQAFKCFEADAGASAVGLVTSGDGQGESSCVAPYGQPHDGDADDGYDTLTVEFDDFDGGETFSFSTDSDPTSIKGAEAPGPGDSGSVSGLELAGETLTVNYADGTTQTVRTFDDGAATPGGAVAAASNDTTAAPTLGVQGVTLDAGALDARHSAAAVPNASRTVTVTGAPAGATIRLVRVEGALFLEDASNPSTNVSGYDVEPYEANTALNRELATATADASGEATVEVALRNSTDAGGLNYLAAAVVENGTPGAVSNVVVLRLDPSATTEGPPALPGFENAPTDPDGDGVYEDVNGNGAFTLADVTALFANTDSAAVTENPAAFDVNGNGEFTLADVTALFDAASPTLP
jgi:PKD repeat protein